MPYRRQDSEVWWVSFTDARGKRIRRSTGTADRREAEALEAKWKLEAFKEQQWETPPTRTFEEVMVTYLKATQEKRSAKDDRNRTKKLREFFGSREMNTLQPLDIRRYIAQRRQEIAPATINRELSLLSVAINYVNRELEWQLPNPVQGRKLREPEGRVRWLTREQALALIEAAKGLERAQEYLPEFLRLALNTGCRSGELLGLEWARVDLQNDLIHLEAKHTKAGKRRSIPINTEARKALVSRGRFRVEHCPSSPWVFCKGNGERLTDIRESFKAACQVARIENFRIHDLRHTCAAWLVSNGAAMTEIRDILGHSSVTMTERYAHLAPENLRGAVKLLDRLSHDSVTVPLERDAEKRQKSEASD